MQQLQRTIKNIDNMAKRKLFVLMNNVWDANDWLNDRNCNPKWTDTYLYATAEQAEQKAKELDVDDDIYNDGTIYEGEISDDEILKLTGYETIEEFDEALAEPYSTEARVKNLGEDEKGEVAAAIIDNPTDERPADCANYDFNKSLDGAILVFWSWERYIGYARKFIEIRRADGSDTEAILTKEDKVFATQCDVLLTADEVSEVGENLHEAMLDRLQDGSWKWQNERFMEQFVEEF